MIKGHKLIFNKYRLKSLIHSSNLGKLYEGINEKENIPVAIKMEKRNRNINILESEAYYLMNLKGYGIPKLITFGHHGLYNVLIEELLGLSLENILTSKTFRKFSLKDVCMIALQALDRLEFIHSKYIIHRDIKPNNFVIGRKDPELIYLIDFGLSRKYKSSRTGKHIQFQNRKLIYGSALFLSINGNKGYEQSRRDDLESLGYMLIYLANGYIPWENLTKLNINIHKRFFLIYKMKNSISTQSLCKKLPKEMATYINYCKKLYFDQDPDYNYLKSLFYVILYQINQKNDLKFFWITNKLYNKIKSKSIIKKKSRKISVSPHVRLLNKIKKTLRNKTPNQYSVSSKSKKSFSFFNISFSNIYKDNNNIDNEKESLFGEYEVTDISKGEKTNRSSNEKYIDRNHKNSNFSFNNKISKIKRNENIFNYKNNIYIEQKPKINYLLKSPININNINLIENEKNNINLEIKNKDINDMKIINSDYSSIDLRNLNNKFITNLNYNSKEEECFNKEINEENKKIARKNRFITISKFWDNNTDDSIEDNNYNWNDNSFENEFHKLHKNIEAKIELINNNNNFKNEKFNHIKNINKNKKWIDGSINELKQIISNRIINNFKPKNYKSRLLNKSEKDNSSNKYSIYSKNEMNNSNFINKKTYKNHFKGINLETNKLKNNNLLIYNGQYKYQI